MGLVDANVHNDNDDDKCDDIDDDDDDDDIEDWSLCGNRRTDQSGDRPVGSVAGEAARVDAGDALVSERNGNICLQTGPCPFLSRMKHTTPALVIRQHRRACRSVKSAGPVEPQKNKLGHEIRAIWSSETPFSLVAGASSRRKKLLCTVQPVRSVDKEQRASAFINKRL